jgi:hypothetical protein
VVSAALRHGLKKNVLSWATAALCDPSRADVGSRLPFALDVLDGRVEAFPTLVDSLQSADHFDHRATVEVVAGLARARIAYRVEPWADRVSNAPGRHPNPDLEVDFGERLPWEVKRLQMANRAVNAMHRWQVVLYGPKFNTPIGLATEFLPTFTRLERTVEREARLDLFCARLNMHACARAEEMRRDGIEQSIVGNVLRLHLQGLADCTYFGPCIYHPADAARAVDDLDGASGQLDSQLGMVVLVPDMTVDAADLARVADQWLRGPDAHVLGVVIVHDVVVPRMSVSLRCPSVVWREGLRGRAARVQRRVQRGPWPRFFAGLNARRMQLETWRRKRCQ